MTASSVEKSPMIPADKPFLLSRILVPVLFLIIVGFSWAFLFPAAAPTTVVFAPSVDIVSSSPPPVSAPAESSPVVNRIESTSNSIFVPSGDIVSSSPPVPAPSAGNPVVDQSSSNATDFLLEGIESMSEEERLERVLRKAATEDGTVVLTLVNEAWSQPGSVLELFKESFRAGNGTAWLLDHLVIVSVDEKAHRLCLSSHPHCFALVTEGVDFSGYKQFMSADYLRMMWRRLDFLRIVLERGFNFIFSDVDIMWFRDPFPRFVPDGDVQLACDRYVGDPASLWNSPNNGFNYVRANNRTVAFYKFWYESRARFPGVHEQNVLNLIKRDPYIAQIGVRLRFLDTKYFSGLCQKSDDFNKVCTFHVNCCIGLSRKIYDLNLILNDWRSYLALPPAMQTSLHHNWTAPHHCRLDFVERPSNKTRHRRL